MAIAREPTKLFYKSSKTYVHAVGLSCCFRQWRASSHCRYMHGYALQVRIEFIAKWLDDNNWAVDFGSLKPVKAWLEDTFDHKTLVAKDDPQYATFESLHNRAIIQMVEVDSVGCEKFAELIFRNVERIVEGIYPPNYVGYGRIELMEVEVREHEANSATVRNAKYGY